MRLILLAGLVSLALAHAARAAGGATALPLPARRPDALANGVLEQQVIDLVNHARTRAGVRPLLPHPTLRDVARSRGRQLFAAGVLTHTPLDGRSVRQQLEAQGIRVAQVAETLAYAADVLTAHRALLASRPHRLTVLSPVWRVIGVGVLDGSEDGVVVVELFAR